MTRRLFLTGISAGLLVALFSPAKVAAQVIVPPRLPLPKVDGIQEAQKEVQRRLEQQALQNRRDLASPAGQVRWGGLRLKKVTAAQQELLGLPDNEGMVVLAVDANSPADKAGVKVNDILIKIGAKAAPNDASGLAKLVKEQNATAPMDLVVVRNGKEETIKGAQMPLVVQATPSGAGGGVRIGGLGGLLLLQRGIKQNPMPNPNVPNFPNPFQPQENIQNLKLEMTSNGAKISRTQTNDQFSGEYSKGELKITVTGKIQNGQAVPSEITVQEGKTTTKYMKLSEVPAQHRAPLQRVMPTTAGILLPTLQGLQDLQGLPGFPGLPVVPGLDK